MVKSRRCRSCSVTGLASAPVLLRNWIRFRNFPNIEVHADGPVRASGRGAIKARHQTGDDLGVEHYIELAWLRRPDAIIVILDADDDCPKELARSLLERASGCLPVDFPVGIVVANTEYEVWFLAALASGSFRKDLVKLGYKPSVQLRRSKRDIESIRDCKKAISKAIGLTKYEETIHQKELTGILPFTRQQKLQSRSFRKLVEELDRLLVAARVRRSL